MNGLIRNNPACLYIVQDILSRSPRIASTSTMKLVFLITDGESDGDPKPVAESLKNNGIVIFTFGIDNSHIEVSVLYHVTGKQYTIIRNMIFYKGYFIRRLYRTQHSQCR